MRDPVSNNKEERDWWLGKQSRALAITPNDLRFHLRNPCWRKRTNSCKLSSNLYMCAEADTSTQTQRLNVVCMYVCMYKVQRDWTQEIDQKSSVLLLATHTVCNSSTRESDILFLPESTCIRYTYMHAYINENKRNNCWRITEEDIWHLSSSLQVHDYIPPIPHFLPIRTIKEKYFLLSSEHNNSEFFHTEVSENFY